MSNLFNGVSIGGNTLTSFEKSNICADAHNKSEESVIRQLPAAAEARVVMESTVQCSLRVSWSAQRGGR